MARATFTLKCRFQTLLELPPEFAGVQMVMVTSSGGTPGPFLGIPAGEVGTPTGAFQISSKAPVANHVWAVNMLVRASSVRLPASLAAG